MRFRSTIRVESDLAVNDKEAEILELLCSYGLADWLAEKCSKRYSKEEINQVVQGVRRQASSIVKARKDALMAIRKAAGVCCD